MINYPDDWEFKKLGELCFISSGFMGDYHLFCGKYKLTRIETIANGIIDENRIGYSNIKPDDSFKLKIGDILYSNINSIAHIGKVARYDKDYNLYHGCNLLRLSPHKNIYSDFLFYILTSERCRNWAKINANPAVNQASINQSLLKSQKIITPPLPEQIAIAEALTAFDTHITNLDLLIEKKKAIRDGALEDLMTGRTRLKGFYGERQVKKLGEIASFNRERNTTQRNQYISTENMKQNFSGIERYNGHELVMGIAFNVDNVLIANIRPYLKKIYFADFSGSCSPDVLVLKAGENICGKYLYYCVANNRFINYVMNNGVKGTKMPRGDKQIIVQYSISLPPLDEQNAIAQTLTALDDEIQALESEREKFSQIRDGAMNDLLTGKVRLKNGK